MESVPGSGWSGAIYTQTTDVENEVNVIPEHDRRLVKRISAQRRSK